MRKSTAANQRQLQDLHGERNYRVFAISDARRGFPVRRSLWRLDPADFDGLVLKLLSRHGATSVRAGGMAG
jgi:hypothetical protein